MGTQSHSQHHHHDRAKVTKDFPEKTPNKETQEAMKESEEGRGIKCESIEDLWKKMGMKPSAYS